MTSPGNKPENFDTFYVNVKDQVNNITISLIPYARRFVRFLALPYCYFKLIDWEECKASRFQVFKDILFIFFRLKYFPDNYSPCRLWEKKRSLWPYYYGSIYDPYQRGKLRIEVQKREYMIVFDDKYLCYQLCMAAGLPLPKEFGCIEPNENYNYRIRSILSNINSDKIIIKPILSDGGKNIAVAYKEGQNIFVNIMGKKQPLNNYIMQSRSVIQEYIQQHDTLIPISPATNTIRIVTLYTKDKNVLIIGALMRFGRNKALIDNISQGGIAVGIDLELGSLKKFAHDAKGKIYDKHPDSGFIFNMFPIPYWKDVVKLAKDIQLAFPYYKLLGDDIAITPSGPIIIEINSSHDNVGLERSFGPILLQKAVRDEFEKYNLLINDMLP